MCGIWTSLIIHTALSSTVDCWELKFRIETHSNHHHHKKKSDILTSSLDLMGEVDNNEESCKQVCSLHGLEHEGCVGGLQQFCEVHRQMWIFLSYPDAILVDVISKVQCCGKRETAESQQQSNYCCYTMEAIQPLKLNSSSHPLHTLW